MVSGLTLQWWEVGWLFGVSLFLCGSVEFSLNCFTAFKCMLGHAVQQITRITQLQSEKYKGKNAAKYSDLLINDIAWLSPVEYLTSKFGGTSNYGVV